MATTWLPPLNGHVVMAYFAEGSQASQQTNKAHPALVIAIDDRDHLKEKQIVVVYGSSTRIFNDPWAWTIEQDHTVFAATGLKKATCFNFSTRACIPYNHNSLRVLEGKQSPVLGRIPAMQVAIQEAWEAGEERLGRPLVNDKIPHAWRWYVSRLAKQQSL